MPAPKLIGVASEASWYGLPYGVLVTAATWAAQGYRVLVVDAEPADLALTSLAHAQPQRGDDAPFVELLRDRGARPGAVVVTETLGAALHKDLSAGLVAVVPAYDEMPSRRPVAPGASLVTSVRERLQRVELDGRVADLVLVSLPPLDTPFGVAVAANLLDVLVLITSAKGTSLRRTQRSLAELGAFGARPCPSTSASVWAPRVATPRPTTRRGCITSRPCPS
jgi:cellulose biosynthesis protein BcsQ